LAEIVRNRHAIGVNDLDIRLAKYDQFGKAWIARFIKHHPQLESARRKYIETVRIKDVLGERLTKWFEDLEPIVDGYNIESRYIYDMDERRFAMGDVEVSQDIINTTIHQKF
jgi:hypothetical protein